MKTLSPTYITTPLYYVNARPHMGHAYTTILADVLKRQYHQRGGQVTLLTGTDEHGEKIARMAAKEGITPQQLADQVSGEYEKTWREMNIDFDIFYRTTSPAHHDAVKKALTLLKNKGEIEFREYEGKYCVGCERFLKDSELVDGKCSDHQTAPEIRKEGNYFFLMSKYQTRLIEYFRSNPNCIRPESYRNEILSFLRDPLEDLCISRPKARLTWGIELPFDSNFVTYVWVDALLNYLAATGWSGDAKGGGFNAQLWESATHLIAKDIVKTHAVYWAALLMALDVKPFKELRVSGYWLMGGTKMSKTLGNVIRPLELEAQYGVETLRFYLLSEMSYGLDSTFTLEGYVNCINAYLANGMGNLASRVLTLCSKNFKGEVSVQENTPDETYLLGCCRAAVENWETAFQELKFQNALRAWSELVSACDIYINNQKPWALAKDPAQEGRLQVVLGTCIKALQTIGVLIYPVLPQASQKLCRTLGLGHFENLNKDFPPIALALDHRNKYQLAAEVPKLFMRVQLPKLEEGT